MRRGYTKGSRIATSSFSMMAGVLKRQRPAYGLTEKFAAAMKACPEKQLFAAAKNSARCRVKKHPITLPTKPFDHRSDS